MQGLAVSVVKLLQRAFLLLIVYRVVAMKHIQIRKCLYLRERIDGEFRYGEDLVGGDEAATVAIELTKSLV